MKLALLGEPSSGKSSFLVASYAVMVNSPDSPFQILETIDEVGFLNRGYQALMARNRVPRTDAEDLAALALRILSARGEINLRCPDRSGELVRNMIDGRTWDPELLDQLPTLDAAMLFIHALRVDPGRTAEELAALLEEAEPVEEPTLEDADPIPWSQELMPSDVRAVDLLQSVRDERSTVLPLAVIVSAWDLVDQEATPSGWLRETVPLLDRFLATNGRDFQSKVFGMSAQGFDFRNPQSGTDELRQMDPWERARVWDDHGMVGVLQPLEWLLEAARE